MGIELVTIKDAHRRTQRKADRNVTARERGTHIENGFPHFSTNSGMCMCLDPCCMGEKGCKCRSCPCRQFPEMELHSVISPLVLTSANTISSTILDGNTNGEQKVPVNGGQSNNG